MLVSESSFEVREKYQFLSGAEKAEFGITREDCSWTDAEFLDVEDQCFFCSQPLVVPCCMWQGQGGRQIYFHPDCVYPFAHRLMRDVDELRIGKEDADELLRQRDHREGSAS